MRICSQPSELAHSAHSESFMILSSAPSEDSFGDQTEKEGVCREYSGSLTSVSIPASAEPQSSFSTADMPSSSPTHAGCREYSGSACVGRFTLATSPRLRRESRQDHAVSPCRSRLHNPSCARES